MKKKLAIFIFSLALLVIAYQFFLGNPQSNNLQSDSTSSQAIAEASQSQPTFGPSLALTTGGEELLSFHYEGIGSDVIVRKNRTFIMRVYYGDKSEGKGYSWDVPALFQYIKTEGMSDGVDGKIVDPFIAATLLDGGPWMKLKNPKTGKDIIVKDVIADAFLQQILLRPTQIGRASCRERV